MAELHPHSARLSTSAGMDVLISSSRCECAQMKVASRNACAPSSRLCTITAHLCTPNRGGQALLRSALNYCISRSPIQLCMSFHSRTSWGNCRWFQQEMTAPFPGKCTAARKRAIHLACATVRDPLALEAPCSTSTPGPWFGQLTTKRMATENAIKHFCTRKNIVMWCLTSPALHCSAVSWCYVD